jgi:hypothetical protein
MRRNALVPDQMRDAVGERAGLARARTGDDDHRPVHGRNRGVLGGV